MEVFNCQLKMLVLFILIINAAHFCHGKALLEEVESNRGERSYDHLPNAGLHQSYDPQSNAEHWMKGKFYQPQVDGQPIYVSAIDQTGSYNEFLDAYYKAYTLPTSEESKFSVDMSTSDLDLPESEDYDTPEVVDKTIVTELNEETPDFLDELENFLTKSLKKPELPKTKPKDNKYNQPVIVKTVKQKSKTNNAKDVHKNPSTLKSIYRNTEVSVIKGSSDKYDVKYASPVSKEMEFSAEISPSDDYDLESEDYDDPDIVDKIIATELNNEKSDKTSELEDQEKIEEPVIRESLKKSELTKSKDHTDDIPVVVKTVKQKPNAKKDFYKIPSTPKSIYKNTEKTVIKDASDEEGVKYVSPVSKESEFSIETSSSDLESVDYDDPDIVDKTIATEFNNEKLDMTPELEDGEKFEEPVIRESLKKSELTKPKDQYDMPIVVKAVKQKPKINNAKKDSHKNPSAPKNTYKSREKTTAKGSDKKNGLKYESAASKEFSVEMNTSDDYDLQFEDYDGPEVIDETIVTELNNEKVDLTSELANKDEIEPVLRESLRKSELSKTKSKGNNQYERPVVVKTKQQKLKTNNSKKTTQKRPNTQKKPQLELVYGQTQTIKRKPNKKPIGTASEQKYCDQTSQGTLKKSKGKRRKQYSKPNSRTGEAVDQKENLDSNTTNEDLDELSNTKIETQKKVVKPKPVKTKEKVVTKQDSQYESVTKVNVAVKSNYNDKPLITDKNSKPLTTKEKVVVKTDQYKPAKNKENVKYDIGKLEKEDLLTRKLNSQDKDLSESDIKISTTDNLLQDESDFGGSLNMSEREFSEKLNSESTTIQSDLNLESSNSGVLMKPESIVSNINDFRGFSSMNSNIWSMLFNPNAEQNKLKLKRCITRSNETGFCTYIQNCEVPHIATSLEQLLNNACVIDDIFIGVCCPEFPVQTVKVHWDQTPSDFDNTVEDEFGHIAEDCGIRSNKASELQSWPWKAQLVSMSNGKIFCGGVVVSEDHVLTAAHCTTKIPKNQILVRLGQYDDESGDDYAVVEIKRHAQYNPRTMQNDIALLKLGRRIMNDAQIGIVCLPDEEHQNNHNGEIATLLGWRGIFGTKSRDAEFLRVISNKECQNKLGMKVLGTLLCTETRKESERTCNADSGAPLVIEDGGSYEVIGILSWNRNDCDQRFPSTFSRVSSYAGWIKNHIG